MMYESLANNDDKFGGIATVITAARREKMVARRSTKWPPIAVARYELRPKQWTSPVAGN